MFSCKGDLRVIAQKRNFENLVTQLHHNELFPVTAQKARTMSDVWLGISVLLAIIVIAATLESLLQYAGL